MSYYLQRRIPMLQRLLELKQFTSDDYQRFLKANALVCSMSAVGRCADNAACEGFFGMLKRERVYHRSYPTLEVAKADVFDYIDRF